jgi:hypothetical protein
VWNELCKRPAIRHYDVQRCKREGKEMSHLTREQEQQSQLCAGAAAMQHVKDIRARGAKMTSADPTPLASGFWLACCFAWLVVCCVLRVPR